MNLPEIKNSEFVVFKPKNAQTEFQVILDGEHDTVWATEQQIMDLFGKARRTIEYHIKNIYEEGELDKEATWREFRKVPIARICNPCPLRRYKPYNYYLC